MSVLSKTTLLLRFFLGNCCELLQGLECSDLVFGLGFESGVLGFRVQGCLSFSALVAVVMEFS